jgi:hypothetical protein
LWCPFEVSGSTSKIENSQNERRHENFGKGILRGKGNKLIRFQFINKWKFLYQNWTAHVITLNEYTYQVSKFYLQNSRRYKQKTNFDCQIKKNGRPWNGRKFIRVWFTNGL